MLYLVTGADGFMGRHFLAELARRRIPTVAMLQPGAPQAELPGHPRQVIADLLASDSLASAVQDVTHVIHLAARVHVMQETAADPEQAFHEVNVEGTLHLLNAAAAAGATHFLLMSSVAAMSEEAVGTFDETAPCHPESPYGRSKLAAERAVFETAKTRGLAAMALRAPMVYGPGNKGNMLRLLEAAAQGKRLPLGCVRNQRSAVYVGNVVSAALRCLASDAAAGEVFLVCDGRPYSSRELYAAISQAMTGRPLLRDVPVTLLKFLGACGSLAEKVLRRQLPVNRGVIRRLTGDLCYRTDKIRKVVGFTPEVDLAEGVARTVEWYVQGCPPTPPA